MVPAPPALHGGGGGGQGAGHAARVHRLFRRERPVRQHLRPHGGLGRPRRQRGAPTTATSSTSRPSCACAAATATSRSWRRRPWARSPAASRVATNVYEVLKAARGQADPVLPGPLRRPRGAGRGRLRVPGGGAALQPELRQEPRRLRVHGRAGRLVGRGRRRHRLPLRDRLLPGRHRGGDHGLRRHPPRRHPAHRARGLPQRLRGHLARR